MLLGSYQNLCLLNDEELLEENDYLIIAEKNIKDFGKLYREIGDYDISEPVVYGKLSGRLGSLRKLLVKEWEDRNKKNIQRGLQDFPESN